MVGVSLDKVKRPGWEAGKYLKLLNFCSVSLYMCGMNT